MRGAPASDLSACPHMATLAPMLAEPAHAQDGPVCLVLNHLYGGMDEPGFGTWLDSRELIPGDELTPEIERSVSESSHFVLLWSAYCVAAEWIKRELDFAAEASKRIFLVRLDDTSVPREFADKLRIEAQAIPATEAARLVAVSLEREEQQHSSRASQVRI